MIRRPQRFTRTPTLFPSTALFRSHITIRIDDDLYARLSVQARNAGLGAATYCRDILERFEGTDPSGYHARFDELHATAIQAFAILATSVGERSPDILQKGLGEARRLLRERGLLDPEDRKSTRLNSSH